MLAPAAKLQVTMLRARPKKYIKNFQVFIYNFQFNKAAGARVSGGHLCEYNEQKRCPSRQASNACSRRIGTCKLTAGAYVSSIDYLQNVRDDCLHI